MAHQSCLKFTHIIVAQYVITVKVESLPPMIDRNIIGRHAFQLLLFLLGWGGEGLDIGLPILNWFLFFSKKMIGISALK